VLDGLRLSLTLLTVAPVRGPASVDRRTAGRAMELAPLVGLALGLLAALVLHLLRYRVGESLLAGVLAIGLLALLTRGLHLDGLADLADGLGSRKPPVEARALMKRPDVGAFGVAWLVFVPLVQVSALVLCARQGRGTASLVLAVMAGRLAMTAACRATSAAAPDGLGALVARMVRRGVTGAWFVVLAAGFGLLAVHDGDNVDPWVWAAGRTVLALALALLVARLVRAHAQRRLGGLTGDVLGALSEIATAVCLVVLTL